MGEDPILIHLPKWFLQVWAVMISTAMFQLTPVKAWAQSSEADPPPLVLSRLTGPIELDGFVNDPAWAEIDSLGVVMYSPIFMGQMTEKTDIRVAYDDQYLYLGGRLYDSNPDGIRANSMYRDRYSGDDTIALILDTFNDRQNGLWFAATPNGVRLDMAVSNDLDTPGGNPFDTVINLSWNTFWDAATQRTDHGWSVEMRIPFTSLGFQTVDGLVEMGLSVTRRISRKNEIHEFPATPPNWDLAYAKPSKFRRIQLHDINAGRPVYITPYIASGAEQYSSLSDDETQYIPQSDWTGDIGGDVKYNITNNLTLDLTVNTDFAQVEVDDQQVNLTRFSLFFPEKRRFFQERSGIFEFRTSGRFDRLFNTREIGLYEGNTVPIYGGARLVGRVGEWDVGAINMQTASAHGNPSENFGVYRIRKQVFNPSSYVGSLVTTRLSSKGSQNVVYGLDSRVKIGANEYVDLKWAQAFDETADSNAPRANGFIRGQIERLTQIGFSYRLSTAWGGREFEPGVGFVSRTGFVQPFILAGYGWFASERSKIQSIRPQLLFTQFLSDSDGGLETQIAWLDWSLNMKSGDSHTFQLEARKDNLTEPAELPEDTDIPPGEYTFYNFVWNYMMRFGRLWRINASTEFGQFYDGSNIQVELEPTWNLSRYLEFGGTYQFNRVRFPDRDQEFFVHLARIRTQISFSTATSVSAFLQYSTAADVVSANVRFRYNFHEGNDFWLVYNEGRNTDRLQENPVLPVLDSRTIFLKYTYTFIR